MDKSIFKYYQIIGQIQKAVNNANTLQDAIKASLKIVVQECGVENLIVWYEDVKGDSVLHPYYWICPFDITNKHHKSSEGMVGEVYLKQESIKYLKYNKGMDKCTDEDLPGLKIKSMICVPLSNKYDKLGCIQFINEKSAFSDEQTDVLEMLATLIAINIDENIKLSKETKDKKVIISARNIKKSYKNGNVVTNVLKGVNLDIYEGEFVTILGESGCGKSTLLNIIGGLDKADEGSFTFNGVEMVNASEKELTKYRRDNIGFVFQSYNLMPNLNSVENLDLIAELVDKPRNSKDTLKLVNLDDRQKNYPSQLSGGEQQRVSIARSIVKNPKMIFLDEPTAALDYQTSITVLSTLESIAKSGTTLIMVTHNEEITKMSDRVVRFRDGKIYEVTINTHPLSAKDLIW